MNEIRDSRATSWIPSSAKITHIVPNDQRAIDIHRQMICIVSPVALALSISELPYVKGKSDLRFFPIRRIENPAWPVGPSGKKEDRTVAPSGRP